MLSKFSEFLNKFDDEKFLVNAATSEGRQKRIAVCRLSRLSSSVGIGLAFILVIFFQAPWVILFTVSLLLFNFITADSQIKMLLLFEKIETK